MATKNCPHCSKQVPVACKKCACGHVFFVTRKSATNRENSEDGEDMPVSPPDSQSEANRPTRRSGRVTRERPNFYDALQYENQTRRASRRQQQQQDEEEDEVLELDEQNKEAIQTDGESFFPHVFVTVGTTKFDELVKLILNDKKTLQQLHEWKTKIVFVQKGSSTVEFEGDVATILKNGIQYKVVEMEGIHFGVYDYKPSIKVDMEWANLVISHAGAGTTMDALELNKPLIVVPNRNLMDDHQLELAEKLAEGNHALLTSIQNFHKDQKQLLRQTKQGKSEDQDDGSDEADVVIKPQSTTTTRSQLSHEKIGKETKTVGGGGGGESKPKKRRGRPPGITGNNRKPNQGYKITVTSAPTTKTRKLSSGGGTILNEKDPDSPNSDVIREEEDKALIASITAEKALQYNIVLQDINSKIGRVSWRAIE